MRSLSKFDVLRPTKLDVNERALENAIPRGVENGKNIHYITTCFTIYA